MYLRKSVVCRMRRIGILLLALFVLMPKIELPAQFPYSDLLLAVGLGAVQNRAS